MFKLGDYVTTNDNTGYSSMRNLNGVIFKVIGIEDDNDRAIITVCDKTVIKESQKSSFNSNFSYTTFSFGMLHSSFDYLGDEFEDFDDEDDDDDKSIEEILNAIRERNKMARNKFLAEEDVDSDFDDEEDEEG